MTCQQFFVSPTQREGHADGWVVVYSISDRESFKAASTSLGKVWSLGHVTHRAVILVANKTDLERTRVVNTAGKGGGDKAEMSGAKVKISQWS